MQIHFLFSGSKGNATRFLSDSGKADVLVDAGESWSKIQQATGEDNFRPHAIIVTHEHYDHIKGAGIVGRATGAPIYLLKECYDAKGDEFFKGCDVNFIKPGDSIEVEDLTFNTFTVKHDSNGVFSFTVEEKGSDKKLAFLTDTGAVTKLMKERLRGCDGICIEMDYNMEKLAQTKEYDPMLKHRISSAWGHLSNQQALELIEDLYDINDLDFIVALHLSQNTNSPDIVLDQMIKELGEEHKEKYFCAPLDKPLTF